MTSVKSFGAVGDGKADDTQAVLHAVQNGDGWIRFPRGQYRITQTIEVPFDEFGRFGLDGTNGTATVIMTGPGPAFRLIGTHQGTGDPGSVKPNVWQNQRMPTVQNLEILGAHPEADGVELVETMQAVFEGVLIRQARHGIHLVKRNRNVLISHCHIYHNTGVGIFLDGVNLHQINIASNHISYNRLGGIRIERSEVRNLQITGNDIEYNNHRAHRTDPQPTAEIYVDTTADKASVAEVTVASNTIQATSSPGGANIRIVEKPNTGRAPELWTICGNIIGSQENNIHLTGCHGMVISGNFIYSCTNRNLLAEDTSQLNVNGNSFRRHGSQFSTGVRLVNCQDSVLNSCTIEDESEEGQVTEASLIELEQCDRITITGCQVLSGVPYGMDVFDSHFVNISSCTVMETRREKKSLGTIRFRGTGSVNLVANNLFDQAPIIEQAAQVEVRDNLQPKS